MHRQLTRTFYARNTHVVAKDLLGKLLVRNYRGQQCVGRICEVESYVGEDDAASHARFGKTKRNEVMYGQAGHAYVYFIYGMYDMLNIVTEVEGFPAAVLIRGIVPVLSPASPSEALGRSWDKGRRRGVSVATAEPPTAPLIKGAIDGPGRLTCAFKITRSLNSEDLTTSKRLFVADDGFRVKKKDIQASPRIGVAYAGEHAQLPWRYMISL